MSTEIVEIPALLEIKPFPALGSANYNQEAYENGVSVLPAIERAREIVAAGRTNALAAKEQALAAQESRVQAGLETTAIKNAAALEATAIKNDAITQTGAIRDQARDYRDAASISALAAQSSANFKGEWASLVGALARPATVLHAGKFWVLLSNLADVAAAEPGISPAWAKTGSDTPYLAYEDRSTLRAMQAAQGDQAVVDGLGLFVFSAASSEPDDDETCFLAVGGCWLLQTAHPDLLAAWQLPDDAARDEAIEALGRILRSTAVCPITSVASVSQAIFMVSVPGAVAGCATLATPLGSSLDARLAITASVVGAGTVAITLNNPSASVASIIPATWQITVFKEI